MQIFVLNIITQELLLKVQYLRFCVYFSLLKANEQRNEVSLLLFLFVIVKFEVGSCRCNASKARVRAYNSPAAELCLQRNELTFSSQLSCFSFVS